jgi:hypothetical protein
VRWLIPITVVEYGRSAVIEADSKTEAIKKLRCREWDELTDEIEAKVTKVGAARREQ